MPESPPGERRDGVHESTREVILAFEAAVSREFAFLAAYGLARTEVEQGDSDASIGFEGERAAVRIDLSIRDNSVQVWIVKRPMPWRALLPQKTSVAMPDAVNLDWLIDVRKPDLEVKWTSYDRWMTPAAAERVVERYAEAMRAVADDFLRGDFSLAEARARLAKLLRSEFQADRELRGVPRFAAEYGIDDDVILHAEALRERVGFRKAKQIVRELARLKPDEPRYPAVLALLERLSPSGWRRWLPFQPSRP